VSEAVTQSAATGRTSNRVLQNIMLARSINSFCRTTLGPWDVGQLDEEHIEMFLALSTQLPQVQAGISRIEQSKAAIRRNFAH